MRIFVDSDVVISSVISDKGAASLLFEEKNLKLFVSNFSSSEMKVVVKRLNLKEERFEKKWED